MYESTNYQMKNPADHEDELREQASQDDILDFMKEVEQMRRMESNCPLCGKVTSQNIKICSKHQIELNK